jgi:hypothetical protein
MNPVELTSFQCITRAVFNTASMTASYAPLNGTGFSAPIKILKIINLGTNGIDISYDGVNDSDYYVAAPTSGSAIPLIINFQANHSDISSYGAGTLYGRQGQIIYGKGTAGTGNLYIIGYY